MDEGGRNGRRGGKAADEDDNDEKNGATDGCNLKAGMVFAVAGGSVSYWWRILERERGSIWSVKYVAAFVWAGAV